MWKGDPSGRGLYSSESALTPQSVSGGKFGKLADFTVDGLVMAQPLIVAGVDTGAKGVHDLLIVTTEHDSVYAFDARGASTAPLWERHYVGGDITTAPDNFGGRTTLGGEIGITGTPVVDSSSGTLYFVTTIQRNGRVEQWLRAVDIRTGADVGPGGVAVQASVPGDGVGSSNGSIAFDPSLQNQRMGLTLLNGNVIIGWGSFSDWGVYHGWLMAYDKKTLNQVAAFISTPAHQAQDTAFGPADFGGGGAFWAGGAAPSVDSQGNIYVVTADGSFNADQGGPNYGDSVLKLRLAGNSFTVVDWFTPSNQACVNPADLEIGSGGVALMPSEVGGGKMLGMVVNKEGRVYVLDTNNLGKYNASGDTQIPQQFLAGGPECFAGVGPDHAEGSDWNRLYGNVSYWNSSVYLAPSNSTLRQYKFQGSVLGTSPASQSKNTFGLRGGNIVVSSSGTQNAIVWVYEKSSSGGRAVLHAYDANDVSHELWNSGTALGAGTSFGVPLVWNGRVYAAQEGRVSVLGLMQ